MLFSQPQIPVILHISARAPAIMDELNKWGYGDFKSFESFIKITQRIPVEYIVKYDMR